MRFEEPTCERLTRKASRTDDAFANVPSTNESLRRTARDRRESAQWRGERGSERIEDEWLGDVKASRFRCGHVHKWRECRDSLCDLGPTKSPFVAVIVWRRNAFRATLNPGNRRDR